jgi:hypothetical protein
MAEAKLNHKNTRGSDQDESRSTRPVIFSIHFIIIPTRFCNIQEAKIDFLLDAQCSGGWGKYTKNYQPITKGLYQLSDALLVVLFYVRNNNIHLLLRFLLSNTLIVIT